MINSAIYSGKVFHTRHVPHRHSFDYQIFLFWLDLDELDCLSNNVKGFNRSKWSPVKFRRSDYLGDTNQNLKDSVLLRMSELNCQPLQGKVFMLGQLRMLGMYFSPVNFYYLQQDDGTYSHLLAEVSNTPWNERHHYLVDLAVQASHAKDFHVSPFNPMDMTYHWKVAQPDNQLDLALSCRKNGRHFDASIHMHKQPLDSVHLRQTILRIPSMTVKTIFGIYWQALKLFVKRTPLYGHPASSKKEKQC